MLVAAWKHDLSPFVIKFSENAGIRWYGLAYVLGFIVGMWLLHIYYKKRISPFDADQQSGLFIAIFLGVLVGGRVGYVLFYTPGLLATEPWKLFYVWEGGMSSHGGFIGVILAAWIMAKRFKDSFFRVGDLLATLAPPGLFFGRIANFINGELWGKPTGANWGVLFPDAPDDGLEPRHPSQLYEAGMEGLLLIIYTQLRVWKSSILKDNPGQLGGEFLIVYSIVRIFGEQFREPDSFITELHLGFLSRGSFLSLFTGLIGLAIIIYTRNVRKRI